MTDTRPKPPSRRWLYTPFIIFALLLAGYTAYWFYAKGQIETGLDAWIDEQRAAGAQVSFTSKRVHGYPYRFALTVDAPHFVAPDSSLNWRGERLQVAMQPWNFNHAIIRSSGRNEALFGNGQNVTALIGDKSAASLSWNDTGLTDFGLTLNKIDLVTANGDIAARDLTANFKQTEATERLGLFGMDWAGITLAPALLDDTNAEFLGTEIQASTLRLSGAGFGLFPAGANRQVEIAQLLLNWGPLKLGAKGAFDVNREGYPDGTLMLRLDEADTLRDGLRDVGLLSAEMAVLVGAIASRSEDGGFFPVPIRDGAVTILGQRLAPAPQIAPPLDGLPAPQ